MKLSFKISLLASVVSIFFMLLVFTNTQHSIMGENRQQVINSYKNDLKQLKNSFDLILKKHADIIHFSTIIREKAYKNPQILRKKFEASMKNVPLVSKMKFISINGKELVRASRDRLFEKINTNISYLDKKIFTEALKGKVYYSDIYFSPKENEMMIDISKNVMDIKTQNSVGVLIVQISLREIQDVIVNKLVNGNGIALLNLHNNQFLYKSSQTDQIDQKTLLSSSNQTTVQIIAQKNIEYILISTNYSFDRLKMKLIIVNSTKNIFSQVEKTFTKNIFLLTIAILILAILMFIFITYSLKPLHNLTQEIQKLSSTINEDKDYAINDNVDEISNIKQHFDLFVKLISNEREKLQHYNENLKQKIEEEVKKNQEKEQALAQNAKLASMGEMIGNIAHQWRQPLSVISTGVTGMQIFKDNGMLTDEKFNETCDLIQKNTEYLSNTIDDFKNFIKENNDKKVFSVVSMINKTISIINSSLKNNYIKLITQFDYDLEINGYENELTQAFINIINNAKDAIVENIVKQQPRLLFIKTEKTDNSIVISITDNGGGISEDIILRIFEPYFTTKHQSVGTGIGLTMVDRIIRERNNGKISIRNTQYEYQEKNYKGLNFTITFTNNIDSNIDTSL